MNHKRFTKICVLTLIIVIFSFPNSFIYGTVLGESEFPAEEEDYFVWETVNATESWYLEVEFVRFTVADIYNETFNSQNYLFMNYTLEFYHRFIWVPRYENSFYMAYNKTLNFLNWSEEGYFLGNLFLFPTPVNLTLIGEAVESHGFLNYTIDGQMLTLDYGNNTRFELTINSSGFSTMIEKITNNTTVYKWELNTEEIIVKVPFGNYFIGVLVVSVVTLTFVRKRNLKKQFE